MDTAHLHAALSEVCPIIECSVGDPELRSTWAYTPAPQATTAEIAAADNVMATIPAELKSTVPTGDFIARWTNAEYKALQLRRTSDNGKTAKDWDNVTSDPEIDMNKKKTLTLKSNLVADGILTQARADEIFS